MKKPYTSGSCSDHSQGPCIFGWFAKSGGLASTPDIVLNPVQLVGINPTRIPLAHVEVFVPIHAHIMAMPEYGLVLLHHTQAAIVIYRGFSTRIGYHLVVFIDQLSAVCSELVESTNVANLPNPHNSIPDALRSTSQKPEPRKLRRAMNFQNGQSSGRVQMYFQKAP